MVRHIAYSFLSFFRRDRRVSLSHQASNRRLIHLALIGVVYGFAEASHRWTSRPARLARFGWLRDQHRLANSVVIPSSTRYIAHLLPLPERPVSAAALAATLPGLHRAAPPLFPFPTPSLLRPHLPPLTPPLPITLPTPWSSRHAESAVLSGGPPGTHHIEGGGIGHRPPSFFPLPPPPSRLPPLLIPRHRRSGAPAAVSLLPPPPPLSCIPPTTTRSSPSSPVRVHRVPVSCGLRAGLVCASAWPRRSRPPRPGRSSRPRQAARDEGIFSGPSTGPQPPPFAVTTRSRATGTGRRPRRRHRDRLEVPFTGSPARPRAGLAPRVPGLAGVDQAGLSRCSSASCRRAGYLAHTWAAGRPPRSPPGCSTRRLGDKCRPAHPALSRRDGID